MNSALLNKTLADLNFSIQEQNTKLEKINDNLLEIRQMLGTEKYNSEQAAQKLGISVVTLRKLRGQGLIEFSRIGERKIEYSGKNIMDYLKGRLS